MALGWQPALVLGVVSLIGAAMFAWPLLLQPPDEFAHTSDAPFVFVLILPMLLAVVLSEVHRGGLDTKALAMLGVLSAIGAVLRPMGAGTAGIELVFFLLVLAGRVYGPGFGFVLGCTTMASSALLTGGVGPWLPFQMLAAGWVGLGAGLLPCHRLRGRAEIALLAAYGAVAAFAYGFVMNLWFWPFTLGAGTQLSYVVGAPLLENLHRFVLFTLATSAWGWDLGRALTNVVAICLLGPAVLVVLRRSVRRASFGAPVTFSPGTASAVPARAVLASALPASSAVAEPVDDGTGASPLGRAPGDRSPPSA
ncbi:MAG: ECF transporter S component [Acidimicrobiia bacterium]|nr:ECF transporter S component [Acidimicrobiia bacterium]